MANYYVAAQHKYRTGTEQEKYVDSGMHREDNRIRRIAELSGGQRLEVVSSAGRKMHLGALSRAERVFYSAFQGRRQRQSALRILK